MTVGEYRVLINDTAACLKLFRQAATPEAGARLARKLAALKVAQCTKAIFRDKLRHVSLVRQAGEALARYGVVNVG